MIIYFVLKTLDIKDNFNTYQCKSCNVHYRTNETEGGITPKPTERIFFL